ncbi:MAG: 50S ribosomal protein L15 [Flavobacteriaceae bacterium]|nr:50S ribosomal protein L15 [Flavobacteriaceae bacterium]
MELHNLKPASGATKKDKRIGRGTGSGRGGTSTRGHKGAQSRSGYSQKRGFEGGQTPLQRRLPKSGFKNINRIEYVGINLDTLQKLADSKKITKFDLDAFYKNGLIQKKDRVKILGRGELTSALEVTVHAYTATAKEGIEKAGGKAETI